MSNGHLLSVDIVSFSGSFYLFGSDIKENNSS